MVAALVAAVPALGAPARRSVTGEAAAVQPGDWMTGKLTVDSRWDHPVAFGTTKGGFTGTINFAVPLYLYASPDGRGDYQGEVQVQWHEWENFTQGSNDSCTYDHTLTGTETLYVSYWFTGPRRGDYAIQLGYVSPGGWARCSQGGQQWEYYAWRWNIFGNSPRPNVSGSRTTTDPGTGQATTETWSLQGSVKNECDGPEGSVQSVWTASGNHHDLAGTRLSVGQTITAPENLELRMGDGSRIRLAKGTRLRVDECPTPTHRRARWYIDLLLGTTWDSISKQWGDENPEFRTDFNATGVRGTVFRISYDRRRKLTTVHVTKGSVSMRNRTGRRRRTVIVLAGRTATQRGSEPPRVPGR